MNTESVDCRRVQYPLPHGAEVKPGDFSWGPDVDGVRHLYICLPGENRMDAIRVQRGAPGGKRTWGWDGNEEKPTTQPSIHYVDHWHGYLRAGRLVSC